MTLGTKPATRKAGEFKAVCRSPRWVQINELLDIDPDTTQSRWDNKLHASVFLVNCAFETTDRKAFEQHMREAHGVKSSALLMNESRGGPAWPTPSAASKPWRGPKLTEEGTPFVSRDEATETCPTCGLVSELPANNAGELWWHEHLERCLEQTAVA